MLYNCGYSANKITMVEKCMPAKLVFAQGVDGLWNVIHLDKSSGQTGFSPLHAYTLYPSVFYDDHLSYILENHLILIVFL